jgi:hypothetical protein
LEEDAGAGGAAGDMHDVSWDAIGDTPGEPKESLTLVLQNTANEVSRTHTYEFFLFLEIQQNGFLHATQRIPINM